MAEVDTQEIGKALAVLRSALGLEQCEMAQAAGLPASSVSSYERGRTRPTARSLERLTAGVGLASGAVESALEFVRDLRGPERLAAVRVGKAASGLASAVLELWTSPVQAEPRKEAQEARSCAPALWARLLRYRVSARRAVVQESPEFRSWALCELLCFESEKTAAGDSARAMELAELALWIAELVTGEERWRSCLQSYSWAFLGNARRVRGNLPSAEEAFALSNRLWQAGGGAASCVIDQSRRMDLEASLRREQRRLPEALALLDRALEAAGTDEAKGRILIKKSKTLEELGDPAGAVAALREATPLVERQADPRLLLCVHFNLLVNLCLLGRHAEAAPLAPEVRELVEHLGNDLDLLRLRWLEGRIAFGLDRIGEAGEALRQVRNAFAARGIAYDAALATLELSVIYLEEGRTAEVRTLAREMTPVFRAQGVHREALAALQVFCDAAEREEATAELARRVLDYLLRGRYEEGLPFESP